MKSAYRPIPVLMVACVYMAVGAAGFVYHFRELLALRRDSLWVELIELLAVVSGAFMLAGYNWARWLAVAWMAFHVAISFPVLRQFVIHLLILALVVWILFLPGARRYFESSGKS